MQQEFAYIPDDGSSTYVINVENNSTQILAGPTTKDAKASYAASITALVQLDSTGALSFLPYKQGDASANSAATWAAVANVAAVAPAGQSSASASGGASGSSSATGTKSGSSSSATATTRSGNSTGTTSDNGASVSGGLSLVLIALGSLGFVASLL